jgi:hypothetical protein
MESVNDTPMKRKRGRPRKTETPSSPSSQQHQSQQNEFLRKLWDEYHKKLCNHIEENSEIKNIKSTINDVSKDLSDILINILKKIDQVKSLTKEITREELIKEIVRDELKKIYQNEVSEIELLKKELFDMKEKFDTIYQSINICEETSAEM